MFSRKKDQISSAVFPKTASEVTITVPIDASRPHGRFAVFASFNQNAEIPEYVVYYLSELRKVVDGIVFIADNPLKAGEAKKIAPFAFHIHAHRHGQYDFGSYKEGIQYLEEHHFLDDSRELLICNDSCYGPFYPFSKLFSAMEKSDADFWGITQWRGSPHPDHVQSYFMVFRRKVLHSSAFQGFWHDLPQFEKRKRVVDGGEIALSQSLEAAGFHFDSLLSSGVFQSRCTNPSVYLADEAIERGDLFLKRSVLNRDYLETCQVQLGNIAKHAMRVIKEKTDYDCSLIYKDLLRNSPQSTIHTTLGNVFILPEDSERAHDSVSRAIAVVAYLVNDDCIEKILHHVKQMPEGSRIVLVSPEQRILDFYQEASKEHRHIRWEFRLCERKETAETALISFCADVIQTSDFVCFINDCQIQKIEDFGIFDEVLLSYSWDSLLKSKGYVENVLSLFERHPEIGILMPTVPICLPACFSLNASHQWIDEDAEALAGKLLDQIGFQGVFDSSPIYPFTGMFWCKSQALVVAVNHNLQTICVSKEKSSYCLKRLWPSFAQTSGYLTGEISTAEGISDIFSTLRFQLKNRSTSKPLVVNRWTLLKYKVLSKYALTDRARKHYVKKLKMMGF